MDKITEYQNIVDDAKKELEKLGVVKNYETAQKFESISKIIFKYEQYIVMIKKYGKII